MRRRPDGEVSWTWAGQARTLPALSSEQNRNCTHVDLHFLVAAIVHNQAMRDPDAVRLHGMAGNVCVIAHIGIVEVGYFLGLVGAIREFVLIQRRSEVVRHGGDSDERRGSREIDIWTAGERLRRLDGGR